MLMKDSHSRPSTSMPSYRKTQFINATLSNSSKRTAGPPTITHDISSAFFQRAFGQNMLRGFGVLYRFLGGVAKPFARAARSSRSRPKRQSNSRFHSFLSEHTGSGRYAPVLILILIIATYLFSSLWPGRLCRPGLSYANFCECHRKVWGLCGLPENYEKQS